MEYKVVLGTLGLNSLNTAFANLFEQLNPETDEFAAAEKFRLMTWPPGEYGTYFFARLTQLSQEVLLELKE